jgi:hypothetical protein
MDQDIQSQLDRAKELMQDLEMACNVDLQEKNVSEKTKNLTQEVLLKIRHLLDQAIRKFFEKYYFNGLSDSEKKSTKVYFPIVSKKEDLKFLGNMKMSDIMISHKDFYKFIDSVQPYNPDYLWLKYLRDYSNEKHIRLTPQTIKKENETKLGNAVHVGRGASVSMNSCFINGIPVDSKDLNTEPLENFDPRLGVQRVTWISFVFSDTDINILQLCKKSVGVGEKIIKNILEFV